MRCIEIKADVAADLEGGAEIEGERKVGMLGATHSYTAKKHQKTYHISIWNYHNLFMLGYIYKYLCPLVCSVQVPLLCLDYLGVIAERQCAGVQCVQQKDGMHDSLVWANIIALGCFGIIFKIEVTLAVSRWKLRGAGPTLRTSLSEEA